MTAERLLEYLHEDEMTIQLTDGQIALTGTEDGIQFWTVFIDEYRDSLIEILQKRKMKRQGDTANTFIAASNG